jgi:hypothetical protein
MDRLGAADLLALFAQAIGLLRDAVAGELSPDALDALKRLQVTALELRLRLMQGMREPELARAFQASAADLLHSFKGRPWPRTGDLAPLSQLLNAQQFLERAPASELHAVGRGFENLLREIGRQLEGADREVTKRAKPPERPAGVRRGFGFMRPWGGEPPLPAPEPPPPPGRVVNTGFSPRAAPETDLETTQPLAAGAEYWFWLEVGELLQTSMEETPEPLPESLPAGTILTVAVFALAGELRLTPGADTGTLRVTGRGSAEVDRQPGQVEAGLAPQALLKRRLLFPVASPEQNGTYRLRCSIYHDHVLVQSRLISAAVGAAPKKGRALRSRLDYKLSHTLDPAHLKRLGPQTLSLFINENAGGTHGFFFEGADSFKAEASLDAAALQDVVTQARKALRRVAWGTDQPWQEGNPYLYASRRDIATFTADLIQLAVRGYLLYAALIDRLSGGPDQSEALAAVMRRPGRIQIASRESARLVVPAAMFYDQPLDTQAPRHRVCDAFLRALAAGAVKSSPCLKGDCPNRDDLEVVCPSGFWGYRHEIGLPVSITRPRSGDAAADIQFSEPASVAAVLSLDSMFTARDGHVARLKNIRHPLTWLRCDARQKTLETLRRQHPHIVYFYCHGGITANNTPFLSVGHDEHITPDNIRAYGIRFTEPRPLVFLNGCMTTALEPEKALDFVSTFVDYARAAGVVGTEITIFEPLATKFAEAFMGEFLARFQSVGEAIRLARLELLADYNPLGLVYIPFALPGLRMIETQQYVAVAA